MSHTLVIAAVTAMLKDILENELANDPVAISIADLLVTALPPDRISVGSDERPQLNVFLYQVSQNRNVDWTSSKLAELHPASASIPNDRADQYPNGNMPLALDLHYLITAYGAKDFQAELLLGYAMQVLHDIPVITQDRVHTALKHAAAMTTFGALSQVLTTLSIDRLAEQVGTIKLSPEFFSMEETSKLWSSLQTHYRPSAAYQASMVLLNSRHLPQSTKPSVILPLPTIDRVDCSESSGLTANILIIYGQQLQGTKTYLRFSGRSALLSPQTVQDEEIHLVLPPDLPAGVHGVQVVHLETNPQRSAVQEISSNLAAFVVQPTLSIHVASVAPVSSPLPDHLCNAELVLTVKPLLSAGQSALLILYAATGDRPSYRFPIPSGETLETLTLSVQVEAGSYWVQLQVDGAQSHRPIAVDLALPRVLS